MENPLSIVPSDGDRNDFPVLKAFQEYIDAEQAKARKRMLGLSVFFIILLFVVVVTFVLILTTILNRNQTLSDRLLDYALKERQSPPVIQQMPSIAPQPSSDIVKTLVERLEKEQAEIKSAFEKQREEAERKVIEINRLNEEKLNKVKAELAKEREKARKEAEKKAAIEQHRRRLYPDYYNMESTEDLPLPPPASTVKRTTQPPRPSSSRSSESMKDVLPPVQRDRKASPLSSLKPVSYFNIDDEDSVPFLLETPKQNK